eukprot:scaffold55934_cov19-Tisochrysis_lutea.AAC.1
MLCLAGPGSARSDFSLVQACTSGGCEAVGALQCFRDKATMCAVGKNCRDSFVPQAPDAVDRGWLRTGHPDGQPKMGAIIATAFEVCASSTVVQSWASHSAPTTQKKSVIAVVFEVVQA